MRDAGTGQLRSSTARWIPHPASSVFRPFDCAGPSCKIEVSSWASTLSPVLAGAVREHSVAGGRILKLLILLFIVLLLFSNRLPSVARSLGQSVIEFKKGINELENSSDDEKSA